MSEDVNFLQEYIKLSEGTEIPSMFSLWCGIWSVGAILGRKVWVDMGVYTVYPNMYTILVAESGRARKSTSVNQAEDIIRSLDPQPNLISQKITPEALIEALKSSYTDDQERLLREKCEGVVIVDELSTFLNRHSYDAGLGSLLIPLYDCKTSFEYQTKGRGKETIHNSCLSMLGASTVDWLRGAIPPDSIGGGLTSRMIFVHVRELPPPRAFTVFDQEKREAFEKAIRALQAISTVEGEITLSEEARQLFVQEYERFYYNSWMYEDKYLCAYASRRHTQVLKLAMVFSLCESTKRTIEVRHLEGAISALSEVENHMKRVMDQITMNEIGNLMETVYGYITKQGIARTKLIEKVSGQLSAKHLSEIIETLLGANKITMHSQGKDIIYRRTERG